MDLWEYCSYNQYSIISGLNRNRTFADIDHLRKRRNYDIDLRSSLTEFDYVKLP